jgi:hypothetical protein
MTASLGAKQNNHKWGLQKELGLWDGFRMGKTHTLESGPAWAKVEKQPPHGQKTLAVCAKNYCSMRKGGKTAPNGQNNYCSMRKKLLPLAQKWKKLLQYAQKTIVACAKVQKCPPHDVRCDWGLIGVANFVVWGLGG